jgi:hypothetical protein
MWRVSMIAYALLGACGLDPAVRIGQNEYVRLDQGANGDVACDYGTLYLPSGASINGELDGTYCVLKIAGTINGPITVTGGILHLIDVPSVNGELDVSGAYELVVVNSQVNGDADIERTRTVTIADSSFNGSLSISDSSACAASNVHANGSIVASGCN